MSVAPYPEYKDSGVECFSSIPEHWHVLPCRAIVDERNEKNDGLKSDFYLSLLANVGIIPYEEKGDIGNKKPEDLEKCKLVERGDLVINSMNYGIGSFGLSELSGVCSPVYIVLRPKSEVIEERFALRIFECRDFQTYAQSFGNGILAHRAAINWDILKVLRVPVPLRSEQNLILQYLDQETGKIDALVAEQERLIALLKEKQRSFIFNFMVNGLDYSVPTKLSGVPVPGYVPEHWEVLPLTRVVRQFVDYRGATPNKIDDGVPLITATQIKDGRIDHDRDPVFISEEEYVTRMTRGFPARGDVLLTTEAPLGEVAQIEDERVAPGQRMILMKVNENKIRSDFLFWHFRSDFGRKELWTRASGSTASGIRSDRLRASVVLVPPLEEQDRIIAAIRDGLARFAGVEAEIKQQIRPRREQPDHFARGAAARNLFPRCLLDRSGSACAC